MKYFISPKTTILAAAAFVLLSLGILSGCVDQKFDVPPVTIPTVNFPSNATIDSVKTYYAFKPHSGTIDTLLVTDDLVIQGVLNSTDSSGNIYKTMYMQDATGGITLSIDQSGLAATYKLGQRIYVKLKGLYLGTYGGMLEIGYGAYGSSSIGRIPPAMLADHIFLDSLPSHYVAPVVITDPKNAEMSKYTAMLIELPKIRFYPSSGADTATTTFVIGNATTNRNIYDSLHVPILIGGKNFIIRTSNYANFATDDIPKGVGTLRGILTVYNSQYQVVIRDSNDYHVTPWVKP
jgi:hypothetical protein